MRQPTKQHRHRAAAYEAKISKKDDSGYAHEFFWVARDLGSISVSDALRRAVFALHPDTTDYVPRLLTRRELGRLRSYTDFDNAVHVLSHAVIDVSEYNQESSTYEDVARDYLFVEQSRYDQLARLEDPEDPWTKSYAVIGAEEELEALKTKLRRQIHANPATFVQNALHTALQVTYRQWS